MSAREPGSRDVNDEFWGDVPEWSGTASTARRSGRRRIGASSDEPHDPTPIGHRRPRGATSLPDTSPHDTSPRDTTSKPSGLVDTIRSAWDGLIGGGVDTTREHRRIEIGSDRSHDQGRDDRRVGDGGRADAEPTTPGPVGAMPFDQEFDQQIDHRLDPADRAERAHRSPQDRVVDERWNSTWVAMPATRRSAGIDPLLARLGAVVIVASLLVPLLVAVMRSNELSDSTVGAIASAANESEVAVIPAPTTPPIVDGDVNAAPPLDPASLPPAVPVNTVDAASSGGSGEASNRSADDASGASSAADALVEDAGSGAPPATDSSSNAAAAASDSSGGVAEVVEPASAGDNAARVEPPVCPVPYRVVEGDFWLRLVDAANVDLDDLLNINRATVNTPLYPGNEICLPEGATTPEPPAPTTTTTTTQPPAATTTTTTTTTTPTTTAPPPTEPPGPQEIKQIVRDVWPDDLEDRALEIVYRESRFVPTAKNFCCYGLFQIYWEVHDVWLVDLGITSATQLYDPETNARAALALYERAGGWGPWGF